MVDLIFLKKRMNSFIYNLYQYFFGNIQPRNPEDQSIDSSVNEFSINSV